MKLKTHPTWPVMTTYDADHLQRIALPLGGIGTGTVSLGGRGDLRDWEIMNRPAKGYRPDRAFFAVWTQPAGGPASACTLEGPIEAAAYEGGFGTYTPNHGLPHFARAAFAAAYPFGQVLLSDPEMPVDVRLEAFNPLVPADADASGIPVAVLRYVLINKTNKRLAATVVGSLPNFIGNDGKSGKAVGNVNTLREAGGLRGLVLSSKGVDAKAEQWGTIALATPTAGDLVHRTAWLPPQGPWGDAILDFWDDFSADGRLENRSTEGQDGPIGSLGVRVTVPPRGEKTVTFLVTWHFPNRQTWTPPKKAEGDCCSGGACGTDNTIGNYYTTQYADAWDVAEKVVPRLARLEAETVRFVGAFAAADLPAAVKEAALYNVSTLRTQTAFRTPDGRFYAWEGCGDKDGCCFGSCTHVWNYEPATAMLFGGLAARMREVEFAQCTSEQGHMAFRVSLPLGRSKEFGLACADGQMGCLMKLYRDWQLSGDDAMLRALWPHARKALAFCWIPGGWDADRDGVMEGCQHNTMDVEYYGPNGQMGSWYLGALRAAEEMARYVGENDFAAECRRLFESGSRWMDANLFNGEYYEHQVRPPMVASAIAPGLVSGMGAKDLADPDYQLGACCLVDQLVGQYMAHLLGLGYLLDAQHVRTTMASIMKHNFRTSFYSHFNSLRTFVLNEESAILMATYPRGRRPRRPFPYSNEVMTGFEYTAAVGMLQEGLVKDGLRAIKAVRDRYDGRKRSPFNEAECGHHYARAMASWAAVLTLTGFRWSGVTKEMTFAAAKKPATWFWSNGYAWGTITQKPSRDSVAVELTVLGGSLTLARLTLAGRGTVEFKKLKTVAAGKTVKVNV